MSTEPPSPVYIPPLVEHTHRGICWADVVTEIEAYRVEREEAAEGEEQQEAA